MPAVVFDVKNLIAELDTRLNKRFSPGKQKSYLFPSELPYLEIDPRAFAQTKVTEAEAEQAVADMLPEALEATLPPEPAGISQTRLPPRPLLRHVYTRLQMAASQVPDTEEGKLILHSYSPNGGWYVMLSPGMYEMAAGHGTTHFTSYSYDRHVPLAFFGSGFVPGIYHDRVAPVDLAVTFASMLRVNQPSAAVGHVLTQAIRPEPVAVSERTHQKAAGQ
jgi:hypothetical protein